MKITITGLGGTGTSTVGKLLAKKLGYKFFSGGDMQRAAAKEKNMSLYEFDEYSKNHPEGDRAMEDTQIHFGKENDNFVLESLLSWYCVPSAFKILFVCDKKTRLERIAERENMSFEESAVKNKARVNTYKERYGNLYGIDNVFDEKHFDTIIDTSATPPEEIVDLIIEKINKQPWI